MRSTRDRGADIASAGWDVYAAARSDDHLRALGRIDRVHPIGLDITDRTAVEGWDWPMPYG